MMNQNEQLVGVDIETSDMIEQQNNFLSNNSTKMAERLLKQIQHHRHVNKPLSANHHYQQQHQQLQGTEIGDEIRCMQRILQEKNDSLAALSLENADAHQEMNRLAYELKQSTGVLERSKEEIWALELENQELLQQINELQHHIKRTSANQQRLIGNKKDLQEELDNMRQQQVIWQHNMEQSKRDKLDLVVIRRKLFELERQRTKNNTETTLHHTPEDSSISNNVSAVSTQFNLPLSPVPSQSLPISSFTKNSQQRRQENEQHIAINSELSESLTIANNTIKQLQRDLDDEHKKRSEMEVLWRDAQEMIEKSDNGTLSISSNDMMIPLFTPLADKNYHNQHQKHYDQLQPLPRSRMVRKKCLSLGDELILANSSMAGSGKIEMQHENDKPESSPILHTTWKTEIVSSHTNLDEIMDIRNAHEPRDSDSKTDSNANPTFTLDDNDTITPNKKSITTGTVNEPLESYGSLLKTESYIYRPSTRTKPSPPPSHHHQQENYGSNTNIICVPVTATEDSGTKIDGAGYIRALTRTMIGDWMWKYTRKAVGAGISENKHKRFCWLHPYSKTLYWSTQEPGNNGCELVTKCVMIESFKVTNTTDTPCFLIQTRCRSLKIQCRDDATYSIWFKSLKHLLIDAPLMESSLRDTTTTKLTNTMPTKNYHPSTPMNEKLNVTPNYHDLHKQQSSSSSSSTTPNSITVSATSPTPTTWCLDSVLSTTTVAGSSSISLPFLPQNRIKSSSPPTTTHHPSFLTDSGASGFNMDPGYHLPSSHVPSQTQYPPFVEF